MAISPPHPPAVADEIWVALCSSLLFAHTVFYNEDKNAEALAEIRRQVEGHGIEEVALFGHSHGGGTVALNGK